MPSSVPPSSVVSGPANPVITRHIMCDLFYTRSNFATCTTTPSYRFRHLHHPTWDSELIALRSR